MDEYRPNSMLPWAVVPQLPLPDSEAGRAAYKLHFVWSFAPGFIGSHDPQRAVTIYRATDVALRDSERRFGLPPEHPARLENHGNLRGAGYQGPNWNIVFKNTTHLGVHRFLIKDGRWMVNRYLGTDPAFREVALVTEADDPRRAVWLLVPRTGAAGRGWDIVHACSGRRLVAGPNGEGGQLRLSGLLHPRDHWEIMRYHHTAAGYRPHFWQPDFFAHAFGKRHPERPYLTGPQAVSGTRFKDEDDPDTEQFASWEEAHAQCAGDSKCQAVGMTNDWGVALMYRGTRTAMSDVEGEEVADEEAKWNIGDTERMRRAFGDAVSRKRVSYGGTGEYPSNWKRLGKTSVMRIFAKRGPGFPAVAEMPGMYRDCVMRYGMDAPVCEQVLRDAALKQGGTRSR